MHPQHWPEDLDYAGKRVVVIGSGATAITLVPAMAETSRARDDAPALADLSRLAARPRIRWPRWRGACCPPMAAYQAVRWKNVALMTLSYRLCRRCPELAKKMIRKGVERAAARRASTSTATSAPLQPVGPAPVRVPRRRLVPGPAPRRASVVTDAIETFTETGLRLASGEELEADIVVTATGLELLALGGIEITVDGEAARAARAPHLQGHDARRRAQRGDGDRLHQRVLDAEVRPHLRVRVPAAQPHARARLRQLRARGRRPAGRVARRCSIWTRATCCARWTSSRARAPSAPWRAVPELRARHAHAAAGIARGRGDAFVRGGQAASVAAAPEPAAAA